MVDSDGHRLPVARKSHPPGQSIAMLVAAGTLLAWAGLWVVILLPLVMLEDADNGRFGHDIRTFWTPEVAPTAITGIVLLAVAGIGRQKRPCRAVLVSCAFLAAATVAIAAAAIALHQP